VSRRPSPVWDASARPVRTSAAPRDSSASSTRAASARTPSATARLAAPTPWGVSGSRRGHREGLGGVDQRGGEGGPSAHARGARADGLGDPPGGLRRAGVHRRGVRDHVGLELPPRVRARRVRGEGHATVRAPLSLPRLCLAQESGPRGRDHRDGDEPQAVAPAAGLTARTARHILGPRACRLRVAGTPARLAPWITRHDDPWTQRPMPLR